MFARFDFKAQIARKSALLRRFATLDSDRVGARCRVMTFSELPKVTDLALDRQLDEAGVDLTPPIFEVRGSR